MSDDIIRVLLVCTWKTPYLIQLWQNVKYEYPNIRFSVLTLSENIKYFNDNIRYEEGEMAYGYEHDDMDPLFVKMKVTIANMPHFDIIHFMWIDWFYGIWIRDLCKKGSKVFVSVGGSDLYRDSKRWFVKFFQKRIIKEASWISSENEHTRNVFYKVYGDNCSNARHSIIRYGVDILDSIDNLKTKSELLKSHTAIMNLKEKWGIPQDKLVVTLGYNGRKEHQHLEMIKAFHTCCDEVLDKYFFIIPMTYAVASEDYVSEVASAMDNLVGTNNYCILRDFLNVDEMAEYVVMSDVMIHVQTTDQLSSTMLAHMYNGNVVIAGDWLPYEFLKDEGVNFYSIHDIGALGWYISDICGKINSYKMICETNGDILYRLSSWESMSREWYNVYNKLYEEKENDTSI